jgi:hypothetical protein
MNGKLIAVALFVLVAGGGAYLYMNNSNGTPEEEVTKAWQNMAEVESLTMNIDLLLDMVDPTTQEEINMSANFTSDIDEKNKQGKAVFSGDVLVQGVSMSAGGELAFIEDNLYGKVDTLPTVILHEMGLGDLATSFIGKDILLMENVSENIEEVENNNISEERAVEMTKEISTKAFSEEIVILTEQGEEKVNGKNATKYQVKIDYEKLPNFLMDITEDYKDDFASEEERLMVVAGIEEFEKEFNKLTEEELEQLEQLKMNLYSDGKYIVRFEMLLDLEEEEVTIEAVFTFSNFNEEFEVTAPEDYILLEELMEQLMPMFMPADQDYGEDSKVITPEMNIDYGDEMTEEELEEMLQEFEQVE